MTDQEINESVARKLGWTSPGPPPDSPTWKMPDGGYDFVPDYCHSIEAAWEVVEYLEKTFNVRLLDLNRWERKPEHLQENWVFQIRTEPYAIIEAGGDTAPVAICLAFLKMDEAKTST